MKNKKFFTYFKLVAFLLFYWIKFFKKSFLWLFLCFRCKLIKVLEFGSEKPMIKFISVSKVKRKQNFESKIFRPTL